MGGFDGGTFGDAADEPLWLLFGGLEDSAEVPLSNPAVHLVVR